MAATRLCYGYIELQSAYETKFWMKQMSNAIATEYHNSKLSQIFNQSMCLHACVGGRVQVHQAVYLSMCIDNQIFKFTSLIFQPFYFLSQQVFMLQTFPLYF